MSLTVTVVGLGYVGCVLAASLAARGVPTFGVDVKREVVDALARGVAPIDEPGLAARITEGLARGTLHPQHDLARAVAASDLSLVCVGTPVGPDGRLVETDVLDACEAIARAAVAAQRSHSIVIRSTVPPGLHERAGRRLQEAVGRAFGDLVTLALNPEFLREGSAVKDVEQPELVVYATLHEVAAARIEVLYVLHIGGDRRTPGPGSHDGGDPHTPGPGSHDGGDPHTPGPGSHDGGDPHTPGPAGDRDCLVRTDPGTAEVLKLTANVWHALKVSFANEVARIAAPTGVDAFAVMDLLCRDRRLNTSAAYLRPGLPFGGACLTKDVSSLAAQAREKAVSAPLIANILASNDAHVEHFVRAVLHYRPRRVAVLGIGFKPGAADVRDSAPVKLTLALLDAGVEVAVADSAVMAARIPPLGLDALRVALGDERAQPSAAVADAIHGADVIVAAHPCADDVRTLMELRPRVPVLDAAGELARRLDPAARAGINLVEVLARGPR